MNRAGALLVMAWGLAVFFIACQVTQPRSVSSSVPLTFEEAQSLVRALPNAVEAAERGMPLACYANTSSRSVNQESCFLLNCVMTNTPETVASATFGHFYVHKYTGQVWDAVSLEHESGEGLSNARARVLRARGQRWPEGSAALEACTLVSGRDAQ